MTVVEQWTGTHARALQAAMRLTNEAFAEHLGVSARTISKWRERPQMVPSPQLQEALDTSLQRAAADTRTRFAANLAAADLAPAGEVRLDQSVIRRLHAAVGDLAGVLAELAEQTEAGTTGERRTADETRGRLDGVQA